MRFLPMLLHRISPVPAAYTSQTCDIQTQLACVQLITFANAAQAQAKQAVEKLTTGSEDWALYVMVVECATSRRTSRKRQKTILTEMTAGTSHKPTRVACIWQVR